MSTKLGSKLASQAGESIGEVLIALLISVLGVVMLVGMITASTRVVETSTAAMHGQYALTGASAQGTGTVHLQWDDAEKGTVTVQQYKTGGQTVFYGPYSAPAGG